MLPLPDEMPKWYTVEPEQERGWTPDRGTRWLERR
jgi:hypothetical protein